MAKTFFIPNKDSILGQQEVLTAKSILALVEGLESHSYDAVYLRQPLNRLGIHGVWDCRSVAISLQSELCG